MPMIARYALHNVRKLVTAGAVLVSAVTLHAFPTGSLRFATADQVQQFFGTNKVKMVFVGDSSGSMQIYYLDYSTLSGGQTPQLIKTPAAVGSILPVISPDGSMMTYATGVTGDGTEPGRGSAWIYRFGQSAPFKVADTAFVPRFVQNSERPEIVYATCADISRAKDLEHCGKTLRREILDNGPGATRTVFDNGSYYGGLSYDENFIATAWLAGPAARMADLRTGHREIVHKLRVVDKDSGIPGFIDTVGCCNPSVSSSRIFTNAMMYFDFGSGAIMKTNAVHPVLGLWGLHARIFIARFPGEILRYYDMPRDPVWAPSPSGQGERNAQEWSYPEWSNHPYYGVATLQATRIWRKTAGVGFDRREINEQVHAMNLKDSSYLKIIQMTDSSKTFPWNIHWPWLWVEVPAGFQEDPAWLSQTIEQRAGIGVRRKGFSGSRGGAEIRFDGGIVTSAEALAEISVHNALGSCVKIRSLSGVTSVSLGSLFPKLDRGVYFVKVRTRTGIRSTFRYILS